MKPRTQYFITGALFSIILATGAGFAAWGVVELTIHEDTGYMAVFGWPLVLAALLVGATKLVVKSDTQLATGLLYGLRIIAIAVLALLAYWLKATPTENDFWIVAPLVTTAAVLIGSLFLPVGKPSRWAWASYALAAYAFCWSCYATIATIVSFERYFTF